MTVSNAGHVEVNGWTVTLELGDGQRITQLWNGALSGRAGSAMVANLGYNAVVAADGSTTFGFLGASSGDAPVSPTCGVRRGAGVAQCRPERSAATRSAACWNAALGS